MPHYRVYFNREKDWPQCWSVDEGNQATEINVCGVRFDGVAAISRQAPKDTSTPETPFAWLDVLDADLVLTRGVAVFVPRPTSIDDVFIRMKES